LYVGALVAFSFIVVKFVQFLCKRATLAPHPELLYFQMFDYFMYPLICCVPVHLVIGNIENTKNSLKKQNYGGLTCMVSTFLYSLIHLIVAVFFLLGWIVNRSSIKSLLDLAPRLIVYILVLHVVSYTYAAIGYGSGMKKIFLFLKLCMAYNCSYCNTIHNSVSTLSKAELCNFLCDKYGMGFLKKIIQGYRFILWKLLFLHDPLSLASVLFILCDMHSLNYSDTLNTYSDHDPAVFLKELYSSNAFYSTINNKTKFFIMIQQKRYCEENSKKPVSKSRELEIRDDFCFTYHYLFDLWNLIKSKIKCGRSEKELEKPLEILRGIVFERNSFLNIGRVGLMVSLVLSAAGLFAASAYMLRRKLSTPVRYKL
ncbi:hypothetical protein ENBRE01_2549, partial [Enteropsectra breve]